MTTQAGRLKYPFGERKAQCGHLIPNMVPTPIVRREISQLMLPPFLREASTLKLKSATNLGECEAPTAHDCDAQTVEPRASFFFFQCDHSSPRLSREPVFFFFFNVTIRVQTLSNSELERRCRLAKENNELVWSQPCPLATSTAGIYARETFFFG